MIASQPDDVRPDAEGFNPSGAVRLDPDVVAVARAFAARYGGLPGGARIPSFDWSPVTSIREPGQTEWRELGPSIALGAYERREVPGRAVTVQDGLAFATKIPAEVLAAAPLRLIVRDDAAPFQLALV